MLCVRFIFATSEIQISELKISQDYCFIYLVVLLGGLGFE